MSRVALTISPRDMTIKKVYDKDQGWWEDRLAKYCALNPDAGVYPNQIMSLFGSKWGAMDYMSTPAVNMAAKVVEFWEAHPSIEELLCKK